MRDETKLNESPRSQDEPILEDLEGFEQQVEGQIESTPPQGVAEQTGESCDGGGAEPTDQPAFDLSEVKSKIGGEENSDTNLPAIQNRADVDSDSVSPGKQSPLNRLLISQLCASVPNWLSQPDQAHDAVELYQKFGAQDGAEALLSALAVGLFNASMDGLDRAARPGLKSEVRQMELKLSQSGAAQITNLIKTLQSHRGLDAHKVSVGSVNVSSGGNAIVGNVAGRRSDKE